MENILYFSLLFFCLFLPFQFALNPAPGFDLAIVRVFIPLLFAFWLFLKIKRKETLIINDRITKLIIAFLFLSLISTIFSQNYFWSLRKILFLFSIAPIYLISVSAFKDKNSYKLIAATLSIGATLLAIIGIIQFISQFIFGIDAVYAFLAKNITPFFIGNTFSKAVLAYPSWLVNSQGTTYMRAVAVFPDPHMLSYYFGLIIPWTIMLAINSKNKFGWFFYSAVILITADILTFTRGGYIALIAASITILPLVNKYTAIKIVCASSLLFVLFLAVPHNPVSNRLTSSFDVEEGSNQARLSNWQQAILIIKENPLGVGIGMYSLAVNPTADYRQPIYAHNAYLDIAAELGIPAAILFVAILLSAFSIFWKSARKEPFFIAGVASITVFSIHSLVESPLYSVHILPLFFIILAMASIAKKYERI